MFSSYNFWSNDAKNRANGGLIEFRLTVVLVFNRIFPMDAFSLESVKTGTVLVIRTKGYLDEQAGKKVVETCLTADMGIPPTLVFNFTDSPVINSSGVSKILELFEKIVLEKNGKIAFVGLSKVTQGFFKVVGLLKQGELFEKEEEAIRSLQGNQ